jgi:S-adenosylmethionine-diacylgycerolhomoserine-N-methlytransferase
MNPLAEARVLFALARGTPRAGSHAEQLQLFYAPQAQTYDAFRERLLHGRRELVDLLPAAARDRIVELGAGTGRNLEFFGPRLEQLDQVDAVDLCPALLDVARHRWAHVPKVRVVEADAWRSAVDNALAILRPGGTLGVVDFYLPAAHGGEGRLSRHARANRFWRAWFAHDGVRLSEEHLPYLRSHLAVDACLERAGAVPYLPWLRVPHYILVGRKPR